MKKIVFSFLFALGLVSGYTQTYYWVGGTATTSFTSNSNWNTSLDGTGTSRAAASGTDVLVVDGSNVGGTSPVTGAINVTVTSTNFSQLKLINNATVNMQRPSGGGGTGTLTVNGGAGEDFVIEAGSSLVVNSSSSDGNVQFTFNAAATGLVSGSFTVMNSGAHRMNLPTAGALVFASGSSYTCNITSSGSSYPFGSSSQSTAGAVVFEAGAHLYYEGGYSPMGNSSTFSAINFRPGSFYHIRATNPTSGSGSFFNQKFFGNIIVENNATMNADGPIYRIENFTINTGCGFVTHTSGQTVILNDLTVNGDFSSPGGSSNTVVLGGNSLQTVSGSGSIVIPNLVIADNSEVRLTKDITVNSSTAVYGKLDFTTSQINGTGSFTARVDETAGDVTGNLVAGTYQITGVTGTLASLNGLTISGAGIDPNTSVVGFSSGGASISLSKPIAASGTGVTLSFSSDTAVLATANTNGFDPVTGSVAVSGTQSFQSGTSYIINAATSTPFGISTGSANTMISAHFAEINAPVSSNIGIRILDHLLLNAKMTLRSSDTLHMNAGTAITGTFNTSNYIVTSVNAGLGEQALVEMDGIGGSTVIPIGTASYYLPVVVNPASSSDITATVFEGITEDGLLTGTAFTPLQKQTVVDAVWVINRVNGTGNCDLQLQWDAALEGSTFLTLPDTDIGIIDNNGTTWGNPLGTGDNTANTATASISTFGAFGIGSVPQVQPFVFNPLPDKDYGEPDFNGGATSLNTTQPIVYSSSNPAVATIVAGNIHITGAGTTDITASQASDGVYPAASVIQSLTVNKALLTITADDKTKVEGDAVPVLTASYAGFVYGETETVLLAPPVISTTATASSPAGTYPITIGGAAAANYTISYVNGTLTVNPRLTQTITFNALPAKTYGNADFAAGATSTNSTIPVTYSSSNTSVAIITGGTIHITGAGTTTITASQAGNTAYFPAADVARTLTVSKAALTIRVLDTSKVEGSPNPDFIITYTGFVLGETAANLGSQPVATTSATTNSSAGYYAVSPEGAVSANYTINNVAGRLTIYPSGGSSQQNLNSFMSNSNTLTVRVYVTDPVLGDIALFDMNGRLVLKRNAFLPTGFMSFNLDVTKIPPGNYVLLVRGKGIDLRKTITISK